MWGDYGGRGGWGRHLRGDDSRPTKPLTWADGRRIVAYLGPYKLATLGIFACVAVAAGLGVIPPLLVRDVIDRALPKHNGDLLDLLVLAMVAVPVASGFVGVLQNYLNTVVAQGMMLNLRRDLYAHMQRLSLGFYTTTPTGQITSRLNNDVNAIQNVVVGTLVGTVTNVITIASTVVVVFAMDVKLAILALFVLPLFVLPVQKVGDVRQRLSRETQQKQADLSAHMQERLSISGFLLTRLFGRPEEERQRFTALNQDLMTLQIRQAMVGRWFFMLLGVASALGPALIYWYGGHLVIRSELTVGTVVAFVAYLGRLYRPVSSLASAYVSLRAALGVFERLFEYMDLKPDVADAPGALTLPPVRGRVTFQHVTFRYPKADRPAVDDLTFAVQPGQLAALVGPSGSGKTTTSLLIPRFYDPQSGSIEIDGVDVRDVTLASLAAQIATVTQETFLFHTSIVENLRYARPEATEAEIVAAARAANIHDFIVSLPEGYDTVVGERGFRLSGGEKQRVAIARAILKDPRILILDEATSSLDSTSEALIQEALRPLLRGRTSIVIAHRLSTILSADIILVLRRGKLVEQGTHPQLLALGGLYASLYARQFRDEVMDGAAPADGQRWRRRPEAAERDGGVRR